MTPRQKIILGRIIFYSAYILIIIFLIMVYKNITLLKTNPCLLCEKAGYMCFPKPLANFTEFFG